MPKHQPINELNNSQTEYVFRKKNQDFFDQLAEKTNFTYEEIEALSIIHKQIVETLRPIRMLTFRDILHAGFDYTENKRHVLYNKVFAAVKTKMGAKLSIEEWIKGLSTMLNGKVEEKTAFAYRVYDWRKTNQLRKEEIFAIMRGCVIKQQADENLDESVRDMIELLIKKLDKERNGDISESSFEQAVKTDSLYLECMGPVFPSREARYAFLSTITDGEILY